MIELNLILDIKENAKKAYDKFQDIFTPDEASLLVALCFKEIVISTNHKQRSKNKELIEFAKISLQVTSSVLSKIYLAVPEKMKEQIIETAKGIGIELNFSNIEDVAQDIIQKAMKEEMNRDKRYDC